MDKLKIGLMDYFQYKIISIHKNSIHFSFIYRRETILNIVSPMIVWDGARVSLSTRGK